jgi:aryl-alcohol dehydrogenase-like predicted oxidoreductase
MGVLEDLVSAGKIRYYGCSDYTGAQMREAVDAAK